MCKHYVKDLIGMHWVFVMDGLNQNTWPKCAIMKSHACCQILTSWMCWRAGIYKTERLLSCIALYQVLPHTKRECRLYMTNRIQCIIQCTTLYNGYPMERWICIHAVIKLMHSMQWYFTLISPCTMTTCDWSLGFWQYSDQVDWGFVPFYAFTGCHNVYFGLMSDYIIQRI